MRFQNYLENNCYAPYEDKYLEYGVLKELIKPDHTENDECKFIEFFERNTKEVFSFVQFKYDDLLN